MDLDNFLLRTGVNQRIWKLNSIREEDDYSTCRNYCDPWLVCVLRSISYAVLKSLYMLVEDSLVWKLIDNIIVGQKCDSWYFNCISLARLTSPIPFFSYLLQDGNECTQRYLHVRSRNAAGAAGSGGRRAGCRNPSGFDSPYAVRKSPILEGSKQGLSSGSRRNCHSEQ